MSIKIIPILLIFYPIFLFAQEWKINTDVFMGETMHCEFKNSLFITSELGFWRSDDFGSSFSYNQYKFSDGKKFFSPGFSFFNVNNDYFLFNCKIIDTNQTLNIIAGYDLKNDVFYRLSENIKKPNIYKFFTNTNDSVYGFSNDTLFKLIGNSGVLKPVKNFDTSFGYYYRSRELSEDKYISISTKLYESNSRLKYKKMIFGFNIETLSTEKKFEFESRNATIGKTLDGQFYVFGENGQVYISTNQGETWHNKGIGKPFYVRGYYQTTDTGILFHSNYWEGRNLYFTYNAGEDWLEVELPKDLINVKGAAIKNNRVLVLGFDTVYQQTRLYQTDDITKHTVINTIKGGQPAPIGLPESVSQSNINIYPNPTNQFFTIETIETPKSIQLFNAVGQLVFTITPTHKTEVIDVAQLPKGLYFVKIQPQNDESLLKKIVVY